MGAAASVSDIQAGGEGETPGEADGAADGAAGEDGCGAAFAGQAASISASASTHAASPPLDPDPAHPLRALQRATSRPQPLEPDRPPVPRSARCPGVAPALPLRCKVASRERVVKVTSERRRAPSPGARRRPSLSRARIVAAAASIVDAEGLAALSMRRLGRELGVQAMSLYGHVSGRDDLLNGVAELVLAEFEVPSVPAHDWQARLRGVIDAWKALAARHPGAFPLLYRARPITPGDLVPAEEILDALRTVGFDARAAARAYRALVAMVDGMLLRRFAPAYDSETSWRTAPEVDPARFPRLAEASPHARGLSNDAAFDAGVDLLLRGLESARPRPPAP